MATPVWWRAEPARDLVPPSSGELVPELVPDLVPAKEAKARYGWGRRPSSISPGSGLTRPATYQGVTALFLESSRVHARALVAPLSVSQLQVAEGVSQEMTQREIADKLGVDVKTVRTHMHHISEKLQRRGQLRGYFRVWVWVHRAE